MNADDAIRVEEVARRTAEALDAMSAAAQRLAEREVEGVSHDRRVVAAVTASGRVTRLQLKDGVHRRYDTSALGELVTRTIQQAQASAREAFDRDVAALTPPEVAESEAELHRIWRE
jgi:DNA-binding protein YbaB